MKNTKIVLCLVTIMIAVIAIACSEKISDEKAKKISDEYIEIFKNNTSLKFDKEKGFDIPELNKILEKYNVSKENYRKWLDENKTYFTKMEEEIRKLAEDKAEELYENTKEKIKEEIGEEVGEVYEKLEKDIDDLGSAAEEGMEEAQKDIEDLLNDNE